MQSVEDGVRPQMELVPTEDRVFEFLLMALRLNAGFAARMFTEHTGCSETVLLDALREPIEKGLIEHASDGGFRPTALGFRFLNDLQAQFLPELAT